MLAVITALTALNDLSDGGVVSFSAVDGKQLEFKVNTYLADMRARVADPTFYGVLDFSLGGASAGGLLSAQLLVFNAGSPLAAGLPGILPLLTAGGSFATALIASSQNPGPAQGATASIAYGLNEALRAKISAAEAANPGTEAYFSGHAGSGDGRVWSMGLMNLTPA